MEKRLYRLPGAWVAIEVQPDEPVVAAFSITITDNSMYYSTKKLSFDYLDIKLGKDTFGDLKGYGAEREPYGEELSIGGHNKWVPKNVLVR